MICMETMPPSLRFSERRLPSARLVAAVAELGSLGGRRKFT